MKKRWLKMAAALCAAAVFAAMAVGCGEKTGKNRRFIKGEPVETQISDTEKIIINGKTATAPVRVGHRTDTAVPYLKAADFPFAAVYLSGKLTVGRFNAAVFQYLEVAVGRYQSLQ